MIRRQQSQLWRLFRAEVKFPSSANVAPACLKKKCLVLSFLSTLRRNKNLYKKDERVSSSSRVMQHPADVRLFVRRCEVWKPPALLPRLNLHLPVCGRPLPRGFSHWRLLTLSRISSNSGGATPATIDRKALICFWVLCGDGGGTGGVLEVHTWIQRVWRSRNGAGGPVGSLSSIIPLFFSSFVVALLLVLEARQPLFAPIWQPDCFSGWYTQPLKAVRAFPSSRSDEERLRRTNQT